MLTTLRTCTVCASGSALCAVQRSGLTIGASTPGMLAPVERRRSGSVSSSSQTGRLQHSRRGHHKASSQRGHSPMCCAAGPGGHGAWDWIGSASNGAQQLQQSPFDEASSRRGAVYEDAMKPVAEVEPRLSSFGWKSEGTRGSRRSRSEARWQVCSRPHLPPSPVAHCADSVLQCDGCQFIEVQSSGGA